MGKIKTTEIIQNIIVTEYDFKNLEKKLANYHPYDLANVFRKLSIDDRFKIYSSLDDQKLSEIISYLDANESIEFLSELDTTRAASIISKMEVDDATTIINEIGDRDLADTYINLMDIETKGDLNYLAQHDEDLAGSKMTTGFLEIDSNIDVKAAMKLLINEASELEIIDPVYVTSENKLVGILALKDLIIARSPKLIKDIMNTKVISTDVTTSAVEAARLINNYSLPALPVLDNQKLVGIITVDDALDISFEDQSLHYSKLSAVSGDIEDSNNILKSIKKRLPWLLGLLIISLVSASIISGFENIIKEVIALIFFQALILDMVGNIGTQSLGVTIRNISHNYLDSKNEIRAYYRKETKITFINSFILSIIAFVSSYLFLRMRMTSASNLLVSIIISLSLFVTLNIAGIIGITIPIILSKTNKDPTTASGPLITTINDLISTTIYFTIATVLLSLV